MANSKPTTKAYSLMDIEMDAANSSLTAEEYTSMLWSNLVVSKTHKKTVNKVAKSLNVYPRGPEVYEALVNHLFAGIAVIF
jgi:ABC-type metal ion transport system substrate-binding protein